MPKSALLNKLEELQNDILTEDLGDVARIYDGGLLIHSAVSATNTGATYGS